MSTPTRPPGLFRRGRVWWTKVYVAGRPVRESTGRTDLSAAKRILAERKGRVATGQPLLPRVDKLLYDEAAADLRLHYQTTGDRDLREAEKRLAHLDRFFAGRRLAAIDGAQATRYVAERQAQSAANSSVNRELSVLGKLLRLAVEHNKLLRLPVIRKLREAAPRSGFVERDAFEHLRRHLPHDLQVAATVAYVLAWRMQSEVLALERRHVDLAGGTVTLDASMTKTDEPRVAFLTPELKALLGQQLERVDQLSRRLGRILPHVFPHLAGRYQGCPIRDFRKRWMSACATAGVPGLLKHDLRRSGVRNLVRSGVPERVAMAVSGHKTRSVFDRYNIVSETDLKEAARRLAGTI